MNDKQLICPFCGGNLTNQGEELASNVKMEYQGDTTAKVRYLICDKCHRDFEVYDPKSVQSVPKKRDGNPTEGRSEKGAENKGLTSTHSPS